MKPTLHCGIQHIPYDGTGRFAAGTDSLFDGTDLLANYWPTHSFIPLFQPAILDQMPDFDGDIFEAQQRAAAIEAAINHHATIILDNWVARFGLASPPGPLRIFVDLEAAPLGGRDPYVDPVYGQRDTLMMTWLCNSIERLAAQRNWIVDAAPYRPLRPTGLVQSREPHLHQPMPDWWIQKWGHPAVGALLRRPIVWVHLFCSQNPAAMKGATHEDYAWRQVTYAASEIRAAGGDPDELWPAIWLEEDVRHDTMLALFRGTQRGIADAGLAAAPHVTVNGGWKLLKVADPAIRRLDTPGSGSELRLTTEHIKTGAMLAEIWNAYVANPFAAVFGAADVLRKEASSRIVDLEADAHQPGSVASSESFAS